VKNLGWRVEKLGKREQKKLGGSHGRKPQNI